MFKLFSALLISSLIPNSLLAATISGQGTWESTLLARDLDGNLSTTEAYYDTVLNITWLADANYSMTSGYDYDGLMTWSEATSWASSLVFNGISGWRLPDTVDVGSDGETAPNMFQGVDSGYNITTHSELSYMFYETLGNLAAFDTSGNSNDYFDFPTNTFIQLSGLTNTAEFGGLQSYPYWSGTEYLPNSEDAWYFVMNDGTQLSINKNNIFNAWAVHDGDVGFAVVPVPAAFWLFGSGLISLVGLTKFKNNI